jgi:predicted O-methyltransferase YrrM
MIKIIKKLKFFFFKKSYPLLSKEEYLDLFNKIKNEDSDQITRIESNTRFKINKSWIDNLALHTQIVKKKSKLNYYHGRLLYSFLRKYIEQNKYLDSITILETGTARGFSSLCLSKALEDSKCDGRIFTIDLIPNDKKIYWNCIDDCEGKKTRLELLESWKKELRNVVFLTGDCSKVLKNFHLDRVNFAFLDAQHRYENIKSEFNFVFKRQKKDDLILFDDVNVKEFPEIARFIDELRNTNTYSLDIIKSTENRSYCLAKKLI